ncbi:MAG TPA: hypothetical protein VMS40_14805, partial [Vicinamibacterales bacterium]|nr:hypothetical protein [Vicinamibacterales bacterium]
MNRTLTARSSLENLRKEAKRWLNAIRTGDAPALKRLRKTLPHAPAQPGLRDVQHALAREYGLPNWAAFKTTLAEIALASSSRKKLVAEFLEHACNNWGILPGEPWPLYAARILARHPQIAS